MAARAMIASLHRVTFERGQVPVLREVTLQLHAGERVALVGENGAGKTSLLRLLAGLEKPCRGEVHAVPEGSGYMPQAAGESLFPWFSILQNVAMPRVMARDAKALEEARARLRRVAPLLSEDRPARGLSGGEAQAVSLARALTSPGPVVLADEPFSSLAPETRTQLRGGARGGARWTGAGVGDSRRRRRARAGRSGPPAHRGPVGIASLSLRSGERAGVRGALASTRGTDPHPNPLPKGEGDWVAIVIALALWSLVARITIGGRPLLAGPAATLVAIAHGGEALAADLLATLARAAAGLFFGLLTGLALGLLVAAASRVAPVVDALLDFARSIPPVVLLPSLLLALGYGDPARVATVAVGCAVIIAASVTTALRAPPSPRAELLRLAGASWAQQLRWTQPWEALPTLIAGLRIAAGMAVVIATVTEMVAGAPSGIGARVVSAQVAGQTPDLTAAIVAIGLAGWALNAFLRTLERGARRGSA